MLNVQQALANMAGIPSSVSLTMQVDNTGDSTLLSHDELVTIRHVLVKLENSADSSTPGDGWMNEIDCRHVTALSNGRCSMLAGGLRNVDPFGKRFNLISSVTTVSYSDNQLQATKAAAIFLNEVRHLVCRLSAIYKHSVEIPRHVHIINDRCDLYVTKLSRTDIMLVCRK